MGVFAMLIGLGLVFFEIQTGLLNRRLGVTGRILIIICGTAFSVWGLKELISSYWPRLGSRGFHFRLPREGAVYLLIMIVIFVGSLIGRSNLLLMVFSMMAGPFVINGKFTYTMLQRLKVRRELPERVMSGETFTVALTLHNAKSWLSAWLMTVHDVVTHSTGYLKPQVLFIRVPPKGERRGHYQLRLMHRGVYEFGPVDVTTRFPLGLVERGVESNIRDTIRVYPRTGFLRPNWRNHLHHSAELVSHVQPQTGPFNDELYRIREYRHGDDPRLIHWRTSARMNEIMVSDYKESRDRDLILVIDPWIPKDANEDDFEAVERSLRFAVTVCLDQLHNSRESSLYVRFLGPSQKDWSGGNNCPFEDLLDMMALIEPKNHEPDEKSFEGLDSVLSGRTRILLISPRPEAFVHHASRVNGSLQSIIPSHDGLSSLYEDA